MRVVSLATAIKQQQQQVRSELRQASAAPLARAVGTMPVQYLTLLFLALPFGIGILGTSTACVFPDFLQTNGSTARGWWGRVREQNTEFSQRVYVDENKLRVETSDDSSASYTEVCLQTVGGAYLVQHEARAGQRGARYACVQFVSRSDHVFQWRKSEVSENLDISLCQSSRLKLHDWIFLDRDAVLKDKRPCSMVGGFSVRVYDKRRGEGVCDGLEDNTRIESECLRGEGLHFYFRQQSCVPDGLFMYSHQHTECLANWQEGLHRFMLIRHKQLTHMWIMRYPTHTGGSFVGYLLQDLVADTDPRISQTYSYMRLDIVPDPSRPVTSLCVDDSEGCDYWGSVCSPGDAKTLLCPRKCGLCNASRPLLCTFQQTWEGDWYDGTHPGSVGITIGERAMTLHGHSDEKLHCIRWDDPAGRVQERYATTTMVVSEFDNGCKPRYACANVLRKSDTSPVMFVRVSASRLWPFTNSAEDPIDCTNFDFENDEQPLGSKFRSKHYKLLYSPTSAHSTRCDLAAEVTRSTFSVRFQDGERCRGVVHESHSGTGMSLNVTDCPSNTLHADYTCIESSSRLFPGSDVMVVTRTASSTSDINCWLFPKRPAGTFYLLEAAHCNENSKRKIRNDRLVPLATFTLEREGPPGGVGVGVEVSGGRSGGGRRERPGNKTASPSDHLEDIYLVVDGGDGQPSGDRTTPPSGGHPYPTPPPTSASPSGARRANNNVTSGGNVTKETPQETGSSASPFVVIAAVVFFAVFQIPCLCRGS